METIREQFHHAIDLVPTILDALGVKPPETMVGHVQSHFDGISMRYSFDAATQRPRDAFLLDDRLTQRLARRLQGRHHPPHPQRLEPVRSRHLAALPRQCRPLRAA
jgi:arylsulfatase A-like enzyme